MPATVKNFLLPDNRSTLDHSNQIQDSSLDLLKKGIWLYFLLLIFEGALRKWFLPGLATPLLVVRDPIALYLLFKTWQKGLLPSNPYLSGMFIIGIISIFTATLLGHGSLPVAIYGARIIMIHFPLIFVIGKIFDRKDVEDMGKALLWISIPMGILITLQFYSPQSAWVNRGVGGDSAGAGFSGAMGYFRPPGTFSFTNGTHLFFGLVGSLIFYFWFNPKGVSKIILILSTLSLVAAIPFSISRSLTFHVALSFVFAMVAISRNKKYLLRMIFGGITVFIALLLLSKLSFFQTGTEAFLHRFESANENEGGLEGVFLDRFLGGMLAALSSSSQQPFFGFGIGMGTNVGSMLLTGDTVFLISEGEWGRVIGELGPLLGLAVILIRIILDIKLTFASFRKISEGNILPWMLLSFGILLIAQAQLAQPTALGFTTLIAGLIIAAMKERPDILRTK